MLFPHPTPGLSLYSADVHLFAVPLHLELGIAVFSRDFPSACHSSPLVGFLKEEGEGDTTGPSTKPQAPPMESKALVLPWGEMRVKKGSITNGRLLEMPSSCSGQAWHLMALPSLRPSDGHGWPSAMPPNACSPTVTGAVPSLKSESTHIPRLHRCPLPGHVGRTCQHLATRAPLMQLAG